MRVAFLSSEVVPWSKTGGLGDVAGALPAALRNLGVDVLTITPLHRGIETSEMTVEPPFDGAGHRVTPRRWGEVVFLDIPELFDRPTIYSESPDEHIRYAVFQHAAIGYLIGNRWRPDVIHCNDWQSGLVPGLLKGPYLDDLVVGGVPTVYTIHNLGYQGRFDTGHLADLGFGDHQELVGGLLPDGYLSFMETALVHADLITTVSPTYAREIQTPEGGLGLDDILRARPVIGILNGIDTTVWNPETDRYLTHRYSSRSLWRKEWNKRDLLAEVDLPYSENVPVLGMVSRLAWQKGVEIMRGPLLHFLDTWDVRFVMLGNGEIRYEDFFRWVAAEYPDKARFHRGYSERLSHRIEAGADIFLMPSMYEPCGLNQMYSLAYGTAPVVRRTGGLADTVADVDGDTGTGFVFDHFTEDGLGWAIGQALTLHTDRKAWRSLQKRQMQVDNSWGRRAEDYLAAYRRVSTRPGNTAR